MLPEGWIEIAGVRFRCAIGITAKERETPREIAVDLSVRIDVGRAAGADTIDATVDYRALARRVIEFGEASRSQLVETLAARLAGAILDEFPAVQEVRLSVEKPGAVPAARSVRIAVSAGRPRAEGLSRGRRRSGSSRR